MSMIKWIALSLVSVLLILVVLVIFLDWHWVRDYAAQKLSDLTGRTVTIEGELNVDWSWAPRLHVERIRFDNASWGQKPYLLKLEALDVSIDLGALLTGRIVLPEVNLVRPDVQLERSTTGKPNWVFKEDPESASKDRTAFPVINRLRIKAGQVAYLDPTTDTDVTATVATLREHSSSKEMLKVQAKGIVEGQPLTLTAQTGTWVDAQNTDQPFPVMMRLQAGSMHAQMDGTLEQPLQLKGMDLSVEVEGSDPALVEAFVGKTLDEIPPYHLQARLGRDDTAWKLSALQIKLGNSDVTGDATFEVQNPRPVLQGTFSSNTLDVAQLLTVLPADSEAQLSDKVQPDAKVAADETPIAVPTDALKIIDADMTYEARQVLMSSVNINDVSTHVTLDNGHLQIEPLQVQMGGGTLTSHVDLDASAPLLQAALQVQIDHVNPGQLQGSPQAEAVSSGTINGTLNVSLDKSPNDSSSLDLASLLQRLQVDSDGLTYRDEAAGTDVQATLSTEMSDKGPTLDIQANGHYRGQAVTLRSTASDVAPLANPAASTALDTEIAVNATQIQLNTRFNNALTLAGLKTDIAMQGASLSDLGPLLGVSLPSLPDYQISGQLERVDRTWELNALKAKAGHSDISGDIAVVTAGERPQMQVDLVSDTIDVVQLLQHLEADSHGTTSSAIQTTAAPPEPSGAVLHVEPLRAMDAVVTLQVKHLIAPQLSLENVALNANLQDGKLHVDPLTLEVEGEQLAITAQMDTTTTPLYATVHTAFQRLNLNSLLASMKLAQQPLGMLSGQINVRATLADAASAEAETVLPFVNDLALDNSHLSYSNPQQAIELRAELQTKGAASGQQKVHINAQGRYRKEDFTLQLRGDSPLALGQRHRPYQIDATVQAVQTKARLQSRISLPLKMSDLKANLDIEGPDPDRLSPLVGFSLPKLPPYHIQGDLSQQDGAWVFQPFKGRVGDSDLAGDIRVDIAGDRPSIKADLVSRKIDLDDLGPLIGQAPSEGAGETASPDQQQQAKQMEASPKALSTKPIHLEILRRLDAEITLKGKRIESKLPLEDLHAKVVIHDGILTMKPLDFGIAKGNLRSSLELNAGADPVKMTIATEIRRVKLHEILRNFDIADDSVGTIGGRVKFWLEGDTVAKMLASADGGALLLMTGGRLDHLLVELAGLDIGEAIGSLFKNQKNVAINCAFLDLPTKGGLMQLDKLVVDTEDTVFLGAGTLDFKTEQMDLVIDPKPKDLSLYSARAPLHITGSFKDPSFRPEASAIARGALSIAMLPTVPITALVSLLTEEDHPESPYCTGLVDTINMSR